jgi:hypothetical protein
MLHWLTRETITAPTRLVNRVSDVGLVRRPRGKGRLGMLDAFGLGMLAQSSLLLAGLLACWITVPTRLVGILAGFGAGAMISAIAFDLVPEATEHIAEWQTVLWMLIGVAIFLLGDWLVDKRFGSAGAGGAMGIVVGSVVDGVPESVIFGIQILTGVAISAGFLAAVFVSNIPQAIAPSADLAASGWGRGGSGRSGCWSCSPAGWRRPLGSWPPTRRRRPSAIERRRSPQAGCWPC